LPQELSVQNLLENPVTGVVTPSASC